MASKAILRWLWGVWRDNSLQAMINATLGVVKVVAGLGSVWAVQYAIDIASGYRQGSLYGAIGLMAFLMIGEYSVSMGRRWLKNILGVKAQNRLQLQILGRMLQTKWRGRDSYHSGDVVNRMEGDVKTVVTFLTETIPNTLSLLLMFLGAFIYLWHIDALLACVTVVILPFFLLVSRLYFAQMRKFTRLTRSSDSQIQSAFQEAIQHRMLINTLECDDRVINQVDGYQTELRGYVRQRTVFSVISGLSLKIGFLTGYLVAFLWAALRLSRHTITFGQMTALLQLVNRIQGPARDLTRLAPKFVSVFIAAERLMELEELPLEERGKEVVMDSPCGIRFTEVDYAYEDGEQVISHLSFDFRPGSCTAILGETGSGKTTLVRLMLSLVQPQGGHVEIYDADKRMPISPLHRCNMVYMPQGNTLMSGTIRDNLLLGNPEATDEMIRKALMLSCAGFVYELPDGLDTICSETGGGLSEGQAQRIAIARSLLRDRSVMLFDEATSALDPETERRLLENILSQHDKTIVFITHRNAVVDYCDQVLRIE